MRVLIADKLAPLAAEALRGAGHEVIEAPSLAGEALVAALAAEAPEALVVRSTKVDRAALAATSALSLVIRAGAGVNTIDLEAAGELGVFVANCPGRNAVAVAELVFGLLLAIDREIPACVAEGRAGRWAKGALSGGRGLKGRTLGLLGMGHIGREVAVRARAFGMPVVAWSRSLTPERAAELGIGFAPTPLDVARQADALSIHTALKPETRGLIGAALLDALPDGAVVLNTARAEVLDEAALLDALDRKQLRAGLDVLEDEPPGKSGALTSPLAAHPRVVLTHHLGASTQEAQDAVAADVVRILTAYEATGRAPNVVNLITRGTATHGLVVRHRDKVGVLAGVLDALRRAHLNVQEMENALFAGGKAAVARIQVVGDPTPHLGELAACDGVLHVTAVSL